eukprot:103463_1
MATVFFIKAISLFIHVFLAGGQRCHSNESIPTGLHKHQSAYDITSNALYLFGGILPQDKGSQSIYKWDINTDTWTELSVTTPTSTPKGSSVEWFLSYVNAAVTINDIVYFIGINDGYYNSGTVYRFRLTTSKWLSPASIAPPPRPSTKGCLSHNTTHILMVGGQYSANPSDLYTDQLQIYSISSNAWRTETINVSPIQGQGWVHGYCQSIGIDLYVFGGSTTESESDAIDNIFKYNPNDKWTSIGHLPEVQGWGSAVYNERSRDIYLVGGRGGGATWDTIYVFDVDTENITDTWTMNHARQYVPTAIINDDLYIFGGFGGYTGSALSSIEVCTIPRVITMDPTANPSASVSPTDNPSKYPSDDPSTAPVRNPSVTPTKQPSNQPSNQPTSASTSHPSHPTLRADIPSLYSSSKSTLTVDVTHEDSSPGTKYNTESAEDMVRESDPSTMIWMIGSFGLIVCIVVVLIVFLYKMMRERMRQLELDGPIDRNGGKEMMGGRFIDDDDDEILEVVNETIEVMQAQEGDDNEGGTDDAEIL